MKRHIFLTIYILVSYSIYAQDSNFDRGLQISGGYIPSQELSINKMLTINNSNAITFDASWWTFSNLENFFALGGGAGFGIRGYRNIPNEMLLNTNDPYKGSATRFDIHIGPAIGFGSSDYAYFVLSPQFGLWYAGMSSDGPKVNFTTAFTLDLVIAKTVSLGITYRATSPRLVSTDWNFYNVQNSYMLIKPAFEFRIGLFLLSKQ